MEYIREKAHGLQQSELYFQAQEIKLREEMERIWSSGNVVKEQACLKELSVKSSEVREKLAETRERRINLKQATLFNLVKDRSVGSELDKMLSVSYHEDEKVQASMNDIFHDVLEGLCSRSVRGGAGALVQMEDLYYEWEKSPLLAEVLDHLTMKEIVLYFAKFSSGDLTLEFIREVISIKDRPPYDLLSNDELAGLIKQAASGVSLSEVKAMANPLWANAFRKELDGGQEIG